MSVRGRMIVAGVALTVGVVSAVAFFATGSHDALQQADSLASVSSGMIGVVALVVTVVFGVAGLNAAAGAGADTEEALLDRAATLLGRKVREQWMEEARNRRLRQPRPIRLRWSRTRQPAGFRAPNVLDGALTERGDRMPASALVKAFRGLPVRQLVVRGRAGSGKSTLAMLFTLAAVPEPGRGPARRDQPEPVPVMLPMAGWRPAEENLRDWAARWITVTYPEIADSRRYGVHAARTLLDQDRILLVLDGLDEMPAAVLPQAMTELAALAEPGGLHMLITTREAEYNRAVAETGGLVNATEVTVSPVTVRDAIAFLTEAEPAAGTRWNEVTGRMAADEGGVLATALSTPLMISLARSAYLPAANRPGELLDFATVAEVEEHLLARFLPTTYRDEATAARAARWLGTLAQHLRHRLHRPDLAWWELSQAVPRAVILLALAIPLGVLGALALWIRQPFLDSPGFNARIGVAAGLTTGVLAGLNAARSIGRTHTARKRRFRVVLRILGAGVRYSFLTAVVFTSALYAFSDDAMRAQFTYDVVLANAVAAASLAAVFSLVTGGLRLWRGALPSRPSLDLGSLVGQLAVGLGYALLAALPLGLAACLVSGLTTVNAETGNIYTAVMAAGGRAGLLTVLAVTGAIGVPFGVGRWLTTPAENQEPVSPRDLVKIDMGTSSVVALSAAVSALVGLIVFDDLTGLLQFGDYDGARPFDAEIWGAVAVFAVVLLGSGAPWVSYTAAHLWLAARGRLPWRLFRFLEDAHERNILRQIGPIYQFRHERVEHTLAQGPGSRPRRGEPVARDRRWRTRLRAVATAFSALVLLLMVGANSVPALQIRLKEKVDSQLRLRAIHLDQLAVSLESTAPDDALRLRIAAAETHSDAGAELAAYMQLRAARPGAATVMRAGTVKRVGDWYVTLSAGGLVTAWDLAAPAPASVYLGTGVEQVVTAGQDRYAALLGQDAVLVDDLATREHKARRIPIPGSGWATLGGEWIAVDDKAGATSLWNLASPASPGTAVGASSAVYLGDTAALVTTDDGTTVWDLRSGRPSAIWQGTGTVDGSQAEDADARRAYVLTDSGDQAMWLLDTSPPVSVSVESLPEKVAVSEDGAWFAMLQEGGQAVVRRADGTGEETVLGADVDDVRFVGATAVTTHQDGSVRLWRLTASSATATVLATADMNAEVASDGGHLLTVDKRGRVALRNLTTAPQTEFVLPEIGVPENSWIGGDLAHIGTADGQGRFWTMGDRAPAKIEGPRGTLEYVGGAGPWTVLESDTGISLWNRNSGQIQELAGIRSEVVTLDQLWLSAEQDEHPGWYLDPAGEPRRYEFGRYTSAVMGSRNGRWAIIVYSGASDYIVTIWNDLGQLPPPAGVDAVGAACKLVGKPLTLEHWKGLAPDLPYHPICA